jgi:chemotaxis signal transduction protein
VSDTPARDRSAQALREEFDRAFAEAPRERERDRVAVLAIRVGTEPAAVQVLETSGLIAAPRIAPLPSRRRELLGLVGLRGAVLPVYSLARLLAYPGGSEEPRWMIIAGTADRVALAFEGFEGHALVPLGDLHPVPADARTGAHVRQAVAVRGETRPLLSIPSLWRTITS